MASGSGRTRGTVSLTHRSIEAFRTAEAPYRISDQRCIGLAVRVAPSGVKTWDLAYRIRGSGKVRRMSLGIRRRDIRELLDAVADRGAEREAEKRRQTVGAMFRWALSQDIVETDATAGLKGYDPGTPRDRVLTVQEIEAFWKWLDSGALPFEPADILKLELLTGARCGEISGLSAEEIDRDQWTWTLPAARSKNKRPRVTPLVGVARQIIEARLSNIQAGPLFTAETGTILAAAHIGHYLLSLIHI